MRQTSHLLQPNSILCVYLLAACTLLLITFGMQSLVLPCKTCNVNYFKTNSRHVGSYISWGESKYSIQYEIILIFLKMFIEMLDLLTAGVVCMHTHTYHRIRGLLQGGGIPDTSFFLLPVLSGLSHITVTGYPVPCLMIPSSLLPACCLPACLQRFISFTSLKTSVTRLPCDWHTSGDAAQCFLYLLRVADPDDDYTLSHPENDHDVTQCTKWYLKVEWSKNKTTKEKSTNAK